MIIRVDPKAQILTSPDEIWKGLCMCERAGRVSHGGEGSANPEAFLQKWWKHESLWEFGDLVVDFTTTRAIANELTRHRMCSFIQESTRYCKYEKDLTVVWRRDTYYDQEALERAHTAYKDVLAEQGAEVARDYLPLMTKARVIAKANFREWRHIFVQRFLNRGAHLDIRHLIGKVYMTVPSILRYGIDPEDPVELDPLMTEWRKYDLHH